MAPPTLGAVDFTHLVLLFSNVIYLCEEGLQCNCSIYIPDYWLHFWGN